MTLFYLVLSNGENLPTSHMHTLPIVDVCLYNGVLRIIDSIHM